MPRVNTDLKNELLIIKTQSNSIYIYLNYLIASLKQTCLTINLGTPDLGYTVLTRPSRSHSCMQAFVLILIASFSTLRRKKKEEQRGKRKRSHVFKDKISQAHDNSLEKEIDPITIPW